MNQHPLKRLGFRLLKAVLLFVALQFLLSFVFAFFLWIGYDSGNFAPNRPPLFADHTIQQAHWLAVHLAALSSIVYLLSGVKIMRKLNAQTSEEIRFFDIQNNSFFEYLYDPKRSFRLQLFWCRWEIHSLPF